MSCSELDDFPQEIYDASGTLFNNIPVICGGIFENGDSSDFCHQLDLTTNEWKSFGTMTQKRHGLSIIKLDSSRIFVLGGKNGNTIIK